MGKEKTDLVKHEIYKMELIYIYTYCTDKIYCHLSEISIDEKALRTYMK